MPVLLPELKEMRLTRKPAAATRADIDRLDQLLIVLPNRVDAALWKKLPSGARLERLAKRLGRDEMLSTSLSNPRETGVVVGRLPKPAADGSPVSTFKLLRLAGKLMSRALQTRPRSLGLMVVGVDAAQAESMTRALVLAASAHAFQMPDFHSKPKTVRRLRSVQVFGVAQELDLERSLVEGRAINLVRWLTAMPPNKQTAGDYRDTVTALAAEHGWHSEFFGTAALREQGAGAFLAVAQGNADDAAGILRVSYRPAAATDGAPSLALVGKGIIFDTGGNNLKPFKGMLDMHQDMSGSAVALASLQALTELKFPFPVDCWLAITENRIGATAYKSRDIVTAANGTTIEVIHTDAEGRMVLADTLALAGRDKPGLMIDYATLTGTCVAALTERYSGVFSNRAKLNTLLVDAGIRCGERVWPFPMDADFEDDLKSRVADILQCSPDGNGDHIHAARFLKRFVPKGSPWVHVDLSAVSSKGGLAQVPAGETGFGVRFTLQLLLDQGAELKRLLGDAVPV